MSQAHRPNQHLVAFVTFLALVPLVYFIPDWVSVFLPENKFINVIVAVGIIVPIISYVILPLFLKVLRAFDHT